MGRNEYWSLSWCQGMTLFPDCIIFPAPTPISSSQSCSPQHSCCLLFSGVLQWLEQGLGLSSISSQLYHRWITGFKVSQSGLLYFFSFSEVEKVFPRFFPISFWDKDKCKGWQFLQVPKTTKEMYVMWCWLIVSAVLGETVQVKVRGDLIPLLVPH